MVKALIDTNIIIDALAAREPFCAEAERVLTLAAAERFDGFITGSSVTDIYYLVRRNLSHTQALAAIKTLVQTLRIVAVGEDECVEAMESGMQDFEDAVIAVCAKRVNADYIVSRDEDFSKAGCPVPVQSPGAFLAQF